MLYDYCAKHRIPFKKIGKVIVAVNAAELETLDRYAKQALANGVTDIVALNEQQVAEMEPAVRCAGGLWSPSTSIIDTHSYITALLADIEANGGTVVCRSKVTEVSPEQGSLRVTIGSDAGYSIRCNTLINSAGLWATDVARKVQGLDPRSIPAVYLAKAHYFTLQGKSPFNRLVYPIASKGGLGIHLTLDMAGQARFGPDVMWVNSVDYRFDESRREEFVTAIKSYYPDLDRTRLQAGYTGVRAKLSATGELAVDFKVQFADEHKIEGLINLYGIESPGLTASLALADYVFEEQKKI
jgi:L-2-hydroxyglutarate oxidase LhgO